MGAKVTHAGQAATNVRVNGPRVLRRLDELSRIGAVADGGVTRPAFSAEDRAAIRYVITEANEAGLSAEIDAAGNLLVRRAGTTPATRPAVLMGSHLDTVMNGGRLDGAYGVVAALEVVQSIVEAGVQPCFEPVAVAFANEEGALFPQPFWGSMALAGQADQLPADPVDRDGHSLRGPLRAIGGDLDAVHLAAWPAGSIRAYLELHIEQGPVLENLRLPVGVVTRIVGRTAFDVHVRGRAGHAGTSPMGLRRDAAAAASRVVLVAERIAARQGICQVATAGRLSVSPGATNVVPGTAFVSVEFRDESASNLIDAETVFRAELTHIAELTGCEFDVCETVRTAPVPTDSAMRTLITSCADDLGLANTTLPSGAGHDAQILAAVAPTGMIFVPSRDGVSHVPEEYTDPEDLISGTELLARVALSIMD